jgi:hypothetical protein
MQKIIYTHTPSGQSWDYRLPKILRYDGKSVMGITEANMGDFGIVKEVVEMPDPVPVEPILPEALVVKEQAFALKLAQLATAFQIDLLALPDINIGSLLTAAQAAGATETEIANASAILMALFNDVVVESCGTSADAWAGLKSRLPGYLQEV